MKKFKGFALKIFAICIVLLLFLVLLDGLDAIPSKYEHFVRRGWVGGNHKYGYQSKVVYFNYTYEISSRDENIEYITEIQEVNNDLRTNVTYKVLQSDESIKGVLKVQYIEIKVNLSSNSTVNESIQIGLKIYEKSPTGKYAHYSLEIFIIVTGSIELHNKPYDDDIGINEVQYVGVGWARTVDVWKSISILGFIIIVQFISFFIVPRFTKKTDKTTSSTSRPEKAEQGQAEDEDLGSSEVMTSESKKR